MLVRYANKNKSKSSLLLSLLLSSSLSLCQHSVGGTTFSPSPNTPLPVPFRKHTHTSKTISQQAEYMSQSTPMRFALIDANVLQMTVLT